MQLTKEQVRTKLQNHQEKVNNFIKRFVAAYGSDRAISPDKAIEVYVKKEDGKHVLAFQYKDSSRPCGWNFDHLFEEDPEWGFIMDHTWCGSMTFEGLKRTKAAIDADCKLMSVIEELFLVKEEKELEDFFA